jgi:hypothetical protein
MDAAAAAQAQRLSDMDAQDMKRNQGFYAQHHFKMPQSMDKVRQAIDHHPTFYRVPGPVHQYYLDAATFRRGKQLAAGKRFVRALWKHLVWDHPMPTVPHQK